jgi:hypothetical protein
VDIQHSALPIGFKTFLQSVIDALNGLHGHSLHIALLLFSFLIIYAAFRVVRGQRLHRERRTEMKAYLGLSDALTVGEQTALARLTARVEQIESQISGIEHDIGVLADYLKRHHQPHQTSDSLTAAKPKRAA